MSDQNTELYVYNCTNYLSCQPFRRDLSPGRYKLEAWGAQGGNVTYNGQLYEGGRGGYVSGELEINEPKTLFIFCGEMGTIEKFTYHAHSDAGYDTRNTFGGGGRGYGYTSDNFFPSSGGGMSFISIGEARNESGILFAGAGAGSGAGSGVGSSNNNNHTYGGYGGGVSGGNGVHCGGQCGTGATQTSPGTNSANVARNGGKFFGGNCGQDGGWSTGGGSGYYGGAGGSSSSSAGGGGSSFIDTSVIKNGITIAGNQEMPSPFSVTGKITGNRGHGYVRITSFGYFLYPDTELLSLYNPGSTLSINFHINSLGDGEKAKITRKVQDSEETEVLSHDDTGEEYHFSDSFKLPETSGRVTFTYYVTSLSGIKNSKEFTVFVNKIPQFKVLNELKPKYKYREQAQLEIQVLDDTKATLIITEPGITYHNESYEFNNMAKNINCSFDIPFKAPSPIHFITIKVIDEFNFTSNAVIFQYEVVAISTPNLRLDDNISFYFKTTQNILIRSSVEDSEEKTNICMFTMLNDKYKQMHDCSPISGQFWIPFRFFRNLDGISDGIYELSIFCTDENGGISNRIIRQIAIISETMIVCSKAVRVRREIVLFAYNIVVLSG